MNLREVSQCPEKAPIRAFFLLKGPTNTFTIKNLLRLLIVKALVLVGNS